MSRDARPHPPDADLRRFRQRRHHHRGRGREPEGQEGRARRSRSRWCARTRSSRRTPRRSRSPCWPKACKRPQNFVGMHFFNPVHMMPLVEVIRGKKSRTKPWPPPSSSPSRMGKTPIVVNDCPGFFVNRVLFPYFDGFHMAAARRRGLPGASTRSWKSSAGRWARPTSWTSSAWTPAVHAAAVMARRLPGPHEATTGRPRRRCWSSTSASARRTARASTRTCPTRRASRRRPSIRRRTS